MADEDENHLDKTSVVDGDTLKLRLEEVKKAPPALVLLIGPPGLMGKQWLLDRPELIIGRDPACDLFVEEKSISKKHARIVVSGTTVSITDLSSTNGTEVARVRIAPNIPTTLQNDTHIKLGSIIFKFLSSGNMENAAFAATFDRSTMDGLTGALNKATIVQNMEDSFKKARLTDAQLSLIVFDLDHFKKINDTFGHQGGDYVLRELGNLMRSGVIRSGDAFGRYGGEEFVVVLLGSPLQRASEVGERIRATVEKHKFQYQDKKIPVTVSVGVAALDPVMASYEDLFEKADRALYASKNAGRNRVSTI